MQKKIYLKELNCYLTADEELKKHPLLRHNVVFDLTKINNMEMAREVEEFIIERGRKLTPLSMRSEVYPYNQLCQFLNEIYPKLESFKHADLKEVEKKAKLWLLKNGKNLIQKRHKTSTGKDVTTDAELIKYIRKLYAFENECAKTFDFNADIWYLKGMPISIKLNPSNEAKLISFKKISQPQIRDEIKKVIYIHLSQYALGTVLVEMTAINRFCGFLSERCPNVDSLEKVDREIFEKYLLYIHTEAHGKKSYGKELYHLKTALTTAGKVLERKELEVLFFEDDFPKPPTKLYKVYSNNEMQRLNAAIVEGDVQIARALMLHQMLGTRISETLTLKRDALYKSPTGTLMIKIFQVKSQKWYKKPISDDIKKLFDAACKYTQERFGDTEYVFVSEKDPTKPIQYSRLKYHLMAMITKNNLRDDAGEKFGVGTHIWRHNYAKRLTELHVDDITIAKLLGHANTSNLKNYRKVGNKMLADETRTMRAYMDKLLENVMQTWN